MVREKGGGRGGGGGGGGVKKHLHPLRERIFPEITQCIQHVLLTLLIDIQNKNITTSFKVGTHGGTSPCDVSRHLVPATSPQKSLHRGNSWD